MECRTMETTRAVTDRPLRRAARAARIQAIDGCPDIAVAVYRKRRRQALRAFAQQNASMFDEWPQEVFADDQIVLYSLEDAGMRAQWLPASTEEI